MKKKILHLNTDLDLTSGVTRHIHLLAKNLSEEYEHHVISFAGRLVKKYNFGNRIVVRKIINLLHTGKVIMPFFVFYYVWKNKIDIVHSHHRYCGLIAAIISKLTNVQTITTVHSKVYGKKKLSYNASTIVAVSKSIGDHLADYYGINSGRIKVINNFIDRDVLRCTRTKDAVRLQLGVAANEILIGYVGRMNFREKGVDLLLYAFEKLKRRFNNVKLILIGDGKDLATIKRLNNDKNLNAIIIDPQINVFDYFQCIDIFVLPSRIDPFPNVMLEAAAMNIPIVASRVDGIPEFIDDEMNGLLFEKNNSNDLVSKIGLMLSNYTLRQELSMRLFAKVLAKYEKSRIIPEYIKLYNGNIDR